MALELEQVLITILIEITTVEIRDVIITDIHHLIAVFKTIQELQIVQLQNRTTTIIQVENLLTIQLEDPLITTIVLLLPTDQTILATEVKTEVHLDHHLILDHLEALEEDKNIHYEKNIIYLCPSSWFSHELRTIA